MQKGLISTEPEMSVPGLQNVWAIDDCAAVVNAHTGGQSPPTAQYAVRQAKQLADNVVHTLHGRPTRAFSYRSLGQVVSLGHRYAIAHIFGVRLTGFMAWLLWRTV